MDIEQKLAYIKRALELGGDVDVKFHNCRGKKEAKKVAVELSKLGGFKHKQQSHNSTHWYKIRSEDYSLETSVFYDSEYLDEDVDLSGGEEHVS